MPLRSMLEIVNVKKEIPSQFESVAKLIGELKLEAEEILFDDPDSPFPAKVVTE